MNLCVIGTSKITQQHLKVLKFFLKLFAYPLLEKIAKTSIRFFQKNLVSKKNLMIGKKL